MTAAVTPFRVAVDDVVLDDLRRRLDTTRWPEAETVRDWSQGIPLSEVRELARYWAHEYDWRARERLLNRHPGFMTEIDGLDIHFLHVRSSQSDALPLVMTHGWPGSIVEFQKIIPLLTEPGGHGAEDSDAFHVVCPALPGHGFSGKPVGAGWGVERIAGAWHELMGRLGYESHYVAQGGDFGSVVATVMGQQAPSGLAAIHTNMPIARPTPDLLENLDEVENDAIATAAWYVDFDSGYYKLQMTRPQTVGYGLADSPVGQLAWIMKKVWQWTDRETRVTDHFGIDELLDNVMLYWVTNSAASSARIYWESGGSRSTEPVSVPTAVSTFPGEIIKTSRRWAAATTYPDITYWNALDHGGHFPAWQLPEVMAGELRAAFRPFR
jgi:epoxide hydrolase